MTDYYVDLSGGAGIGTIGSPWNTLKQGATLATLTSGDTVWVRRNGSQNFAASDYFHYGAIKAAKIVGWPGPADPYYSVRPVAAQAAWDSDPAVRPKIVKAVASSGGVDCIVEATNSGITQVEFANFVFELSQSGAVNTETGFLYISSAITVTITLRSCDVILQITGTIQANSYLSVVNTNTGTAYYVCKFYGCLLYMKNSGGPTPGPTRRQTLCLFLKNAGGGDGTMMRAGVFSSCTFKSDYGYNFLTANSNVAVINGLAGTFKGCVFEWTVHNVEEAINIGNNGITATVKQTLIMDRCEFKSVYSASEDLNIITIGGSSETVIANIIAARVAFTNIKFTGWNRVIYDSNFDIDTDDITCNRVDVRGCGRYTFNKANIVAFNQNTDAVSVGMGVGLTSLCVFKQINSSVAYSLSFLSTALMSGIDADPSTWKKLDGFGSSAVAAPYRVGGEAFSVKLLAGQTYLEGNVPLMSNMKGFETIFAPAASGARTITIYGYYKGFSAQTPDTENLFVELDAITSGGMVITSSRGAAAGTGLTSDASTWSGTSGGTPFKIAISLTAAGDQNIAVRLCTTLSEAGGEIYLDPKASVA
jgi:hypothetical protein